MVLTAQVTLWMLTKSSQVLNTNTISENAPRLNYSYIGCLLIYGNLPKFPSWDKLYFVEMMWYELHTTNILLVDCIPLHYIHAGDISIVVLNHESDSCLFLKGKY